ncbi:uncharacterized protein EDB91DRAFT_1254737 [Suillus paluster]|uniref:uncharacterized protein n=1 Tax=Suillus paluster TaxID=48578 RepID=UPI001B867214|nr:uncharacterized protein EDB91DRAFT_1254737 [Suillus paluster]KAG1725477.1 hypothetical protein EDB91DRAFT_1254737 [Suillus paluster]
MYQHNTPPSKSSKSWSFFPDVMNGPYAFGYNINTASRDLSAQTWVLAIAQGPLTLGLHCSELIANAIQHERLDAWLYVLVRLREQTVAQASEPADMTEDVVTLIVGLSGIMYAYQILNLYIALLIPACVFTLVALRRPRSPQPAAYGHLQTLANLVDEWSPVM